MSSTHLRLHYHVVFSTKNRIPLIDVTWRSRLHDYLGGCIRTSGGSPTESEEPVTMYIC
jgi:hypothetical protein